MTGLSGTQRNYIDLLFHQGQGVTFIYIHIHDHRKLNYSFEITCQLYFLLELGKNLKKWTIAKINESRYLYYGGSDADKNSYHIVKCHSASGLFSLPTQFEQCLQR